MLVAVDIDGCADAYPREFQSLMSALRAAGHQVYIVTGVTGDTPSDEDITSKAQYVASLGLGQCYDRLVVIAAPDGNVSDRKAEYLTSVGADVFIDNDKGNIKAAAKAGVPLCLLPWQSRQ